MLFNYCYQLRKSEILNPKYLLKLENKKVHLCPSEYLFNAYPKDILNKINQIYKNRTFKLLIMLGNIEMKNANSVRLI